MAASVLRQASMMTSDASPGGSPPPAVELVDELRNRLDDDPALATAFAALTPGRQREYNYHIAGAKQAATRARRIDACVPKILAGRGFRDRAGGPERTASGPKGTKAGSGSGKAVLLSGGNPQIPKGDGPEPVAAYLAAMPGWKQDVGRRLDALIERTVPDVRKAVRWNSPFYGVDEVGWFVSYHCFDRYLKVTFLNGSKLDPLPPVGSKDPDARYVHLHEDDELDEVLLTRWLQQSSSLPAWKGF